MKRLARDASGFTMTELLVTMALMGIVGMIILTSTGKPTQIINDYRNRVTADAQARSCMDTMLRLLRSAVPGSVGPASITRDDPENPGVLTGIPGSHIKFLYRTPAQTSYSTYDIYMTTLQPQVHMTIKSPTGAPISGPVVLASNVASLMFTSDARDPTALSVSLHISVVMNGAGKTHDVELLNQEVRVGDAP